MHYKNSTARSLFSFAFIPLCSFTEKTKSFPLVLPLACGGVALLILVVVAVLCFIRHRSGGFSLEKKRREVQKSHEMEVLRPENDLTDDPTVR